MQPMFNSDQPSLGEYLNTPTAPIVFNDMSLMDHIRDQCAWGDDATLAHVLLAGADQLRPKGAL